MQPEEFFALEDIQFSALDMFGPHGCFATIWSSPVFEEETLEYAEDGILDVFTSKPAHELLQQIAEHLGIKE